MEKVREVWSLIVVQGTEDSGQARSMIGRSRNSVRMP